MSPQPTAIAKSSAPLIGVERVRAYIRSRFNPIRSLTPELLSQYLDAFKTGRLRQCALVWDAIEERDDVLSGVIAKRKAAAARHGWEILTLDSIPEGAEAEAAGHKQALETFYNNLTVVNAIDANERGEVSLLLRQMMDAVGKRYAVHEIVWKPLASVGGASSPSEPSSGVRPLASGVRPSAGPSGGGASSPSEPSSPASGVRRPAPGLTAELRFAPLWFFENLTGRLRYLASENALEGVEMDEAAWLVSVGPGLMAACAVAYIYKSLSLKDWVLYNERHGMPGIHGKTDAPKDSDEWEDMVEAVRNFAADWSMVTSSDASIEKVDMAAGGTLPFPPLVERMDRAMAALWRGADLSTMSAAAGDAGQGASLQGRESEILEQDDAQWLSETLSRQLDRRVIEYVFGPGVKPLAYIKIKTAQKQDVAQELLVDAFLRDSGAPLSVKNTLERYRRPVPEANDDLLTPPVSMAGAGIPPFGSISPAPTRPAPFGAIPPASANTLANAAVAGSGVSVSEAVAETLAIRSAWLEPFFAGLEAKARDGSLSESELLAAVEQAARALPDLIGDRPVQEIADVIWKTLSLNCLSAIGDGPRRIANMNPNHDSETGQFAPAPDEIPHEEADRMLDAGFSVKDQDGKSIRFGERVKKYLDGKPDGRQRKRFLKWAAATVEGSHPVASLPDRSVYVRSFIGKDGKPKGFVSLSANPEGEVFNFYRKNHRAVERLLALEDEG